ncbi:MAG: hypothetical protein KKD77_24200 [Gammaproteobacteria bacterium]|nr:hypothetical protein [Gammaproteobacteria bacterium]
MTVTEMDTLLKRLLGDPNGYRWGHEQRREALNMAQREVVNAILGMSVNGRPPFDLLLSIQAQSTISLDSDGYALSGLDSSPGPFIGEQGFVRARATPDTDACDLIHVRPESGEGGDNYFLQGYAAHPFIRFEGGKVYAEYGSTAALSADFVYIRTPKTMVTDGATGYQVATCELNVSLHDLVVRMAEAYCRRMANDFEQYKLIRQETMQSLTDMVRSSATSPTVGDLSTIAGGE